MPGIPARLRLRGRHRDAIVVTNINTGDTAISAGVTFTYVVVPMTVVVGRGPASAGLRRSDRRRSTASNLPTSPADAAGHVRRAARHSSTAASATAL